MVRDSVGGVVRTLFVVAILIGGFIAGTFLVQKGVEVIGSITTAIGDGICQILNVFDAIFPGDQNLDCPDT